MGRPGATAPLTTADIPDNSITTAKIVDSNITTAKILDDNVTAAKIPAGAVSSDVLYLENNTSTQTLSGTYSTERLYLNDSYQLTGDVTVTGHLALGSVADSDVVITQDSTERTITGSGLLESGRLMNDVPSLTGMTGELGSGVTGSPNLNLTTGLANASTTFPAGHVLQVVYATKDTGFANSTTSYANTGSAVSITPKKSTSKIVVQFQADVWYSGGGDYFDLQIRATGGMNNSNIMHSVDTGTHGGSYVGTAFHQALTPVVNTTSSITFTMWIKPNASSRTMYYPNNSQDGTGKNKVNILAWEIAQ